MEKERVLVTGGLGFIGSHAVDLLCEKGYEVFVVDKKLWSEYDYAIPRKAFYFCNDILFKNVKHGVEGVFRKVRPHYVVHCAALARIQPSFESPRSYYETNVLGTLNLLELSREFRVKKFVYSASSSAYGDNLEMPLRENMQPRPLNPYADSKLMGEMLVSRYARTFGLRGISLRYFNVYGPRQPSDGQYATVIGIFLRQWEKSESFTIVPDGYQSRDFTHVSDVARANLLALTSLKAKKGEVINIGCGQDYSIFEVTEIIGEKHYPRKFIESRPGEAKKTLADNTRARELLGWTPEIGLKQGIDMLKKEMVL